MGTLGAPAQGGPKRHPQGGGKWWTGRKCWDSDRGATTCQARGPQLLDTAVSWAGFEGRRLSSDRDRAEGTPGRRTSTSSRPGRGGSQPVEGTAFNSLGRQVGTRRALTGKLVLEPSKPELERLKSPACDSGHPGLPSPPPAPCPRKLRGSVWNCWRLEPGRRAQADFHVASSGPLFPGGTSDGITKPQPRPGPREATGAVAHVSGALRARLWCRQVPGCSQPHLALGRGPGVVGAGVLQELAGSEGEASGLWRETDIQPPWWKMCLPLLFLFLTPPRAGLFGANDPAGPHPRRWLPHLESPGPS